MVHGIVLGLLGLYLAVVAIWIGGTAWLLLWPAVSLLGVAAAYLGLGACVFGKRPDGTRAGWALVLLLPFLLFTWAIWYFVRLVQREACCHQVVPGLWVGRWPLRREVPEGVGFLVDLTAEFPKTARGFSGMTYRCMPVLDGSVPDEKSLAELVRQIVGRPEGVYVHCASGHGRSALVGAAVLMARGLARDPKQAEELLRKARPGIHLNRRQRALLQHFAEQF